jgi:2-polyprenyl-6-methoxyphenol hydroxylase-like FAD-dependent oxidoreductase
MPANSDVLVVGAGPTGLLLAGDLARAGVGCTVLERRGEESNLTRAFAVHARTLEQLDARGVADELVTTGARVGVLRIFDRLEVDLSRLDTRFPYVLVTPQYNTERVLAERARAAGAEIVTDAEVVGLRQDADGVQVDVRGQSSRTAAYVVGTDGIGSFVRRALDIPFPGRRAVQSVALADVRLSERPPDVLTVDAVGCIRRPAAKA